MDLLEDTSASGTLIREGYFTYHFDKANAVLTLENNAYMALLNMNKYVDDTYGFLLSKNREIEVNLNGENVIDLLGSSLDADMILIVKGDGSLTIKSVLEHAKNENPYSIVAIQCKRYNEETKEYEDELYFFRDESGNFVSISNRYEIEEAWNEIKKDSSFLLANTFNEENILLLPSLNVFSVGITKEWGKKHIKTNHMIDYNSDGSVTIRNTVEVESLTFSDSKLKLEVNDIKNLTVIINPVQADNKNFTWSSSNEKVITVD